MFAPPPKRAGEAVDPCIASFERAGIMTCIPCRGHPFESVELADQLVVVATLKCSANL
jgi:hypothetical protein